MKRFNFVFTHPGYRFSAWLPSCARIEDVQRICFQALWVAACQGKITLPAKLKTAKQLRILLGSERLHDGEDLFFNCNPHHRSAVGLSL